MFPRADGSPYIHTHAVQQKEDGKSCAFHLYDDSDVVEFSLNVFKIIGE
jgi:hypothetical protein